MDAKNIITIIVVIVVFVIVLYSLSRKSAKRYYKKAEACHKRGECYHEAGDEELSRDYYNEAEFFRKKAEEMENVVP